MKKCMAYLLVFVLFVTAFAGAPVSVKANVTSDSVLEMKTAATSLNKGDTVDVTLHVRNLATSGFSGYLKYDTSVFGNLAVSQFITPDYSAVTDAGSWEVAYNPASNLLEVKERTGAFVTLPASTDGLLLTIRFTVVKSVTSTTVELNYPQVYKNGGSNPYPSGVNVKINNSKAKKITLATDSVSGYSNISVPVKFTANDGFLTLALSAGFDPTKLVFDSVTIAGSVKGKVTLTNYTVTNSGTKVTANFTATEEIKTTGTLFYMNFHAVGQTGSTSSGSNVQLGSTVVTVYVDSVTNKEESAYALTDATSTITITGKEHSLGDVNGNNKIDLVDALFIIQYYNKARTFTSVELAAADVNRNGTVDLVDALLIMQYYNGVIKSF